MERVHSIIANIFIFQNKIFIRWHYMSMYIIRHRNQQHNSYSRSIWFVTPTPLITVVIHLVPTVQRHCYLLYVRLPLRHSKCCTVFLSQKLSKIYVKNKNCFEKSLGEVTIGKKEKKKKLKNIYDCYLMSRALINSPPQKCRTDFCYRIE